MLLIRGFTEKRWGGDIALTLEVHTRKRLKKIIPFKANIIELYTKTQPVPRSKHTPSQL